MLAPAAQYLRTSRPYQEAYLERQVNVIAKFAKTHEFKIVETYTDAARR
jgi:DNA invertase Pin-like site-specific DNA recombinase